MHQHPLEGAISEMSGLLTDVLCLVAVGRCLIVDSASSSPRRRFVVVVVFLSSASSRAFLPLFFLLPSGIALSRIRR